MPSQNRGSKKLALLVGSNPLPNYVAATVLSASEIVLVYSPQTVDPRDRLRAAFEEKGVHVSEVCIDDAVDVRQPADLCGCLGLRLSQGDCTPHVRRKIRCPCRAKRRSRRRYRADAQTGAQSFHQFAAARSAQRPMADPPDSAALPRGQLKPCHRLRSTRQTAFSSRARCRSIRRDSR